MHSNLRLFAVAGLLVAAGLALLVSPLASGAPDGLNKVAIDHGFSGAEREHALKDGPLAGYSVPGVADGRMSKALSGLIGVMITFGLGLAVFAVLRVARSRHTSEERR